MFSTHISKIITVAALAFAVPVTVLADNDALSLTASSTSVSPGTEVEFVVSIEPNSSAVTGVESFIKYDTTFFERVGSAQMCDSSEFREIITGDWFLESCIPNDYVDGEEFFSTSKTIATRESGYGVLSSEASLYAFKLRVREDASGSSNVTLGGEFPRISRVFYEGVQYNQNQKSIPITVQAESSSSGGSSGGNSEEGSDEETNDDGDADDEIAVIRKGYDPPDSAIVVATTDPEETQRKMEGLIEDLELTPEALQEFQKEREQINNEVAKEAEEKRIENEDNKIEEEDGSANINDLEEDRRGGGKIFILLLIIIIVGGLLLRAKRKR